MQAPELAPGVHVHRKWELNLLGTGRPGESPSLVDTERERTTRGTRARLGPDPEEVHHGPHHAQQVSRGKVLLTLAVVAAGATAVGAGTYASFTATARSRGRSRSAQARSL